MVRRNKLRQTSAGKTSQCAQRRPGVNHFARFGCLGNDRLANLRGWAHHENLRTGDPVVPPKGGFRPARQPLSESTLLYRPTSRNSLVLAGRIRTSSWIIRFCRRGNNCDGDLSLASARRTGQVHAHRLLGRIPGRATGDRPTCSASQADSDHVVGGVDLATLNTIDALLWKKPAYPPIRKSPSAPANAYNQFKRPENRPAGNRPRAGRWRTPAKNDDASLIVSFCD